MLAGLAALWVHAGVLSTDPAPETLEILPGIVLVVLSVLLAGLLRSWQSWTAGAWRAAAVESSVGAVVGLAVGVVAAGIIDAYLDGSLVSGGRPLPLTLVQLAFCWSVVGGLLGMAVGLMRSVRLGVSGLVAGVVGGLLSAPLFLAAGAQLLPDGRLDLGADLAVGAAALVVAPVLVGVCVGLAERWSRTAWVRVVDGPLEGRQVTLAPRQLRIGSASSDQLRLAGEPGVRPAHLTLEVRGGRVHMTPSATVEVNGTTTDQTAVLDRIDEVVVGGTQLLVVERGGGGSVMAPVPMRRW